jgi:hypothetical protein
VVQHFFSDGVEADAVAHAVACDIEYAYLKAAYAAACLMAIAFDMPPILIYIYTHTHTHIYIYIHIYLKRVSCG